jgi:hypothetical protein
LDDLDHLATRVFPRPRQQPSALAADSADYRFPYVLAPRDPNASFTTIALGVLSGE